MRFSSLVRAWLIILPAMIANGVFRELVLRRFLNDVTAETISAVIGIAIIVMLTRSLLRPLAGRALRSLVGASAILVALTVAFEFLFGHYVDRKSWTDLVADYAIWDGKLWPIVLAVLAFMPFLWGRWALPGAPHAR